MVCLTNARGHRLAEPILYYFTLPNYLNHSTTFSKYSYHSSKTLKWVPLIFQQQYKYILKEEKKLKSNQK